MIYKTERIEELYKVFLSSTGITTDSRRASDGKLFVALKGENFDGNDYAEQVVAQGAIGAVVSAGSEAAEKGLAENFFVVEDTLFALQELANYHRRQYKIPVIALTGTNGKTTTKELIRAVLSKSFKVHATEGNLNNHIGVPLTLLGINDATEVAVVEMGASGPSEIKMLAEIAEPTCGLITNVGKGHLLGFGSFEGVMKAKGELYDYLSSSGALAFINENNAFLSQMADERPAMEKLYYGLGQQDVSLLEVTADKPFLRFMMGEVAREVETALIGAYNIDNALAAVCVGCYFGVSMEDALAAVSEYRPTNNRSELKQTSKNLLIVDAYNANPTSMAASLANFANSSFSNKMVILGDMRELGAESDKEHQKVLGILDKMDLKRIILVGNEFFKLSIRKNIEFYPSVEELIGDISHRQIDNYTILIKGSNGIRLQSLLEYL